MLEAIGAFLAALCGGIVGGWFGHKFTLKREELARAHADKNALLERVRIFRVFLSRLRGEIEAISGQDFVKIWNTDSSKHESFLGEAERVRGDFDRESFDEVLNAAAHLQYQTVGSATKDHRDPIVAPINALYEYISSGGQIPSRLINE
jgi:hypothetical protein